MEFTITGLKNRASILLDFVSLGNDLVPNIYLEFGKWLLAAESLLQNARQK